MASKLNANLLNKANTTNSVLINKKPAQVEEAPKTRKAGRPNTKGNRKPCTIYVPVELYEELENAHYEAHTSLNDYVVTILQNALKKGK